MTSCSFAAGTPVATPSGPRSIEDVETGDWVLAKDEETGRVEPKQVSLAYDSVHEDAVLLSVRQLDGGEETVLTTSEHPFYVPGEGWVPAGMLTVRDELVVLSGETVSLESIWFPADPLTAYNFEVEDFHTYAVGEDAIWVHNACDPKKGKKASDSGKNEPHGDGGRAQAKADKRIEVLEERLRHASGNEARKLGQKIKNIKQDAQRKRKGETHHRRP